MNNLILLPPDESDLRLQKLRQTMQAAGADALLVSDNANIYYLTGRVFTGYIYIPLSGTVQYFVRRPVGLDHATAQYIRKPEDIPALLISTVPSNIALELDSACYSLVQRLSRLFPDASLVNGSAILRQCRAVKTRYEIEQISVSGVKQQRVYKLIPHLYRPGMTDIELQIEIERASRLEGCLGQFRISGSSMELYMGNIIAGPNADTPTPYDFAMGGAGQDPSLPVGSNGTAIEPGMSVMVDVNGNYTGYMTDMTRTYALGTLHPNALKAHQCSIDICAAIQKIAVPGTKASDMFELAEKMARDNGLYDYFMGHRQKAGFVGHGLGIEINELPVIAPRSRDTLQEGNVFALEPKFVIPGTGAVGIENTYVVRADAPALCLTDAPVDIVYL